MVGAGAAGLTVAVGLAALGRRVTLVEAGAVGGDCTNAGCIPSKALIRLARGAPADPAAALAEVRRLRDALREREEREVASLPNLDLVRGRARIAGPGRVVVRGSDGRERELRARHVVVATGSRPRALDIPGLPAERSITNDALFDLPAPPRHLAIVGAGPVGVEMAPAFRRLGSRVTMVAEDPEPLPGAGAEASAAVRRGLAERGVDLHLGATTTSYADGALRVATPSGPREVADVDLVLVAVGRRPSVDGLGLERAGVAVGPGGVTVDAWGGTAARGIWAVGDVTGPPFHTNAANAQGRRVVRRIAFPALPARGRPPVVPTAVFGEPEVAHAGPAPAEVARRCHPGVLIRLHADLADLDRAYVDGVREGFAALTAVRLTGRIVAATLVGPHASETISLLALAIQRGIPLWRLFSLVHPYPTYAEAVGRLADEFTRRTLPRLPAEALAYARTRWARA